MPQHIGIAPAKKPSGARAALKVNAQGALLAVNPPGGPVVYLAGKSQLATIAMGGGLPLVTTASKA